MRDFDFQLMELIRGKSEEQIEEIVIKICNQYGINYYQCKKYIEDLLNRLK